MFEFGTIALNGLRRQINRVLFPAPVASDRDENSAVGQLNQVRHFHIEAMDAPPSGFVWIENRCLKKIDDLTDYERRRDELLVPFIRDWMEGYLYIADLKARGIALFDEIRRLNQSTQSTRVKEGKLPSLTVFPLDRSAAVMQRIADRVRYETDKMLRAQNIIDGCLARLDDGKRNDTTKIVKVLMARNDQGEFSRASIVKLRKIAKEMEDKKWLEAMDIIQDAELVDGVASYLMVSVRDSEGDYIPLPLDIACILPCLRDITDAQ